MQDDAENVVRAVLNAAKQGDMTAARLVLDRIAPPRKGRPVSFQLSAIETPQDVARTLGEVAASMADGQLTPEEATAVASVIEVKRKALETVELEERVALLERRTTKDRGPYGARDGRR